MQVIEGGNVSQALGWSLLQIWREVKKEILGRCRSKIRNRLIRPAFMQNLTYLTTKIQCDICKREITKQVKILSEHCDYCISCFSTIEPFPQQYQVINKINFPLFESDWSAEEQLFLLEGVQKLGFGNWQEIIDFMPAMKTIEEIQDHYNALYFQNSVFLPMQGLLSRRDSKGNLVITSKISRKKQANINKWSEKSTSKSSKGGLTVQSLPNRPKQCSNPAEIVGYLPKRFEFQVEYDNEAEELLSEMEFNDDDSEQEKMMKFRLIEIYNHRLDQRIRRKEFVVNRKLLDPFEQAKLAKERSKQEKEIYSMMRIFARFSLPQAHQQLVKGIIKEKQIRQRIKYIDSLKSKGYSTIAEAEQQQNDNPKQHQQSHKKRKSTKQKDDKHIHLSKQQEKLCSRFSITAKEYEMIKETILRQCVRQGIIKKDHHSTHAKVQRSVVDGVFDFLIDKSA